MIGMRVGYIGHTWWGWDGMGEGYGKGVPEEPDKWDIGDHWDNGNNGYKVGLKSQRRNDMNWKAEARIYESTPEGGILKVRVDTTLNQCRILPFTLTLWWLT